MDHISHLLRPSARIAPLSELIDRYDGLLCDIWGVLHNGDAAFSDAVDALCRARAFGRFVILITNAPRLSKDIYPQLARFGVPRDAFDTVITSGDVTAQLIAKQPDVPLFHFGPKRDKSILESLTNPIVDHRDAKLCLLTGPLDDTIETIFLMPNERYFFTSSSLVKQVFQFTDREKHLVPKNVQAALSKKFEHSK